MTSRMSHKLLTIFAGSGYATKVKNIFGSNLVAYWKLNETTGTVAADTSVTGATGTYNSVTVGNVAGPGPSMSPAPTFDGINDNVTFAAGPLTALNGAWNTEELTISLWFKIDAVGHWNDANTYAVFEIGVDAQNRYLLYKSGTNAFTFNSIRTNTQTLRTRSATNETTWIHAAMTVSKSANIFRGFWQGVQLGADQAVGNNWAGGTLSALWTQIGSINNASFWFGNIDQIAIGKVALTPAQIAQLAVAI